MFKYDPELFKAASTKINSCSDSIDGISSSLQAVLNASNFNGFDGQSFLATINTNLTNISPLMEELISIKGNVAYALGLVESPEDANGTLSFDESKINSRNFTEEDLMAIIEDVKAGKYGTGDDNRKKAISDKWGDKVANMVIDQIAYSEAGYPGLNPTVSDYLQNYSDIKVYDNGLNEVSFASLVPFAQYYVDKANDVIANGWDSVNFDEKTAAIVQAILNNHWNNSGIVVNDAVLTTLIEDPNINLSTISGNTEVNQAVHNSNSTTTPPVTNESASPSTANPSSPAMSASNPTPQAAPAITSDEILKYANEGIRVGTDNMTIPDSIRETVQNLVDYAYKNASNPSAVQALTATDDVLAIINGK
jgi:hypothetical protein